MEGLIPMVYKSLKKSKTRQKYECLSSGTALTQKHETQSYNIADFYIKDDDRGRVHEAGGRGAHHRRYNSVVVDNGHAGGFDGDAKPKQLVRFRSHRMFSCVTGTA